MNQVFIHLKLTQHCKLIIPQLKKCQVVLLQIGHLLRQVHQNEAVSPVIGLKKYNRYLVLLSRCF